MSRRLEEGKENVAENNVFRQGRNRHEQREEKM